MTCIVGMLDKNGVSWLGGDSLGSNGYTGNVYKNKKIFKIKDSSEILVGYTSSFRMGQLLQYSSGLFDELSLLKNSIDEEYMVNTFIPNLKDLFYNGDFGKDQSKEGGTFLISVKDKLYEVQCDYSILEPSSGYAAVGSGENFAKSSLYTTEGLDLNPVERITKALESAERFSVSVQRPFYIINSENDDIVEIK